MPPSSPPRHPSEEENSEPYSLMIIVCSGKIQLQQKASCYRGHDYSNRLIFPAGVHWCHTTRSDLQGGVHLVREHPTEAIRHAEAHPTAHQRGPRWATVLRARGSWAIAPCSPGRCEEGEFQRRSAIHPCQSAELDVFQSFRTRPQRGGPTPYSHVGVVCTSQKATQVIR